MERVEKLLFSTIVKKINTNWNIIKRNYDFKEIKNKKILIHHLQSKLQCFEYFIDTFINFDKNKIIQKSDKYFQQEIVLFKKDHKTIDAFFGIGNIEKTKNWLLFGCKEISRSSDYTFNTYIPMSFQVWKQKLNVEKISL